MKNIAILGANGAIGKALLNALATHYTDATIHAFSRYPHANKHPMIRHHAIDYLNEENLANAAQLATEKATLDLVIIATGILHNTTIQPEKSLRHLTQNNLEYLFKINTVIPSLIMKHFSPKLNTSSQSIMATLSARVGSISDNRLGGWYAYRASKAALNMIIKTTAIETKRQNKHAIIIGLHPGTVDSELSKPFQTHVPKEKLFSPLFAAESLVSVLDSLMSHDSGKCLAWDGKEILP